eukprot:Skav236200  [mRNA]  locus=scaffold4200:28578:29390:- [translate_table: standard]
MRWTVNVLYAVLRDVERDQVSGEEERRAASRSDQRPKPGLFPIKRLMGVDQWLLKLFEKPEKFLVRVEKLIPSQVTMGIITDACPSGWGAILVEVKDGRTRRLQALEGLEAFILPEEAAMLGVDFRESSSQAVMEAYAVLRALDRWGPRLEGRSILIRADSTVALAMCQRLSSPTPSLNFIASEISLRLEMYKVERVVHHHIMGSLNEEADFLSRVTERGDAPLPPGLKGVHLRRAPAWTEPTKFLLPPPGLKGAGETRFCPTTQIFESM